MTVDLELKRVTFDVAGRSLSANTTANLKAIAWHGYAIDKAATTHFRPTVIKQAD